MSRSNRALLLLAVSAGLGSCNRHGDAAWERALDADRVSEYERFVGAYPRSKHAEGAAFLARGIRRERRVRPDVHLSWSLPGWQAEEIAREFSAEIHAAFDSLPQLGSSSTFFRDDTVTVALSIGDPEFSAAMLESVRAAMSEVERALPDSTARTGPTVHLEALWPWQIIVLSGDMPIVELSDHARELEAQLLALDGVGAVIASGGVAASPTIDVRLSDEVCARFDMTASTVIEALERETGTATTREELAQLAICELHGAVVRLRDVAQLRVFHDEDGARAFLDGAPAIVLRTWSRRDMDSNAVLEAFAAREALAVRVAMASETTTLSLGLPHDMHFEAALESGAEACKGLDRVPVLIEVDRELPSAIRLTVFGSLNAYETYDSIASYLPGLSVRAIRPLRPEGRGATLAVAVTGDDWARVEAAFHDLAQRCAELEGVGLAWGEELETASRLDLAVDRERLDQLGLTSKDVSTAIATNSGAGHPLPGGRVTVHMGDEQSLDELRVSYKVLLTDVVKIEPIRGPRAIRHVDGQRGAVLELTVFDPARAESVLKDLKQLVLNAAGPGIEMRCLND